MELGAMGGVGYGLHDLVDIPQALVGQLPDLYASQGWGEAAGFDHGRLSAALRAGLGVYALGQGKVLGLARGFSDGWQAAWLSELIVHQAWQGQGIGGALLRDFVACCGVDVVYCEALRGREAFFEGQGFKVRPRLTAMAWREPAPSGA